MWAVLGTFCAVVAVAGGAAFVSVGLWGFGLFFGFAAGGLPLLCLRSVRLRLVIGTDELLVANLNPTGMVGGS